MTTDSQDNKLYKQQIVRIIVSPICCWLLRLASKEPEYAVFLSCLCSLRQPCSARLGEMNTTAWLLKMAIPPWKRKILRWRFFSPSAGLDLVRADRLPLYLCTIRNGFRGFACAFAYNTFGFTPLSDQWLANDCSWWAALSCLWVRCKDGRIVRLRQMCPSNRTCRMWLE